MFEIRSARTCPPLLKAVSSIAGSTPPQNDIARAIPDIYEDQPYPKLGSSAAPGRWRLPPFPWIKAIWQRQQPLRRILVAGCGTGSEACALCRRFPDAEIVAIDFSPRSIRAAKD